MIVFYFTLFKIIERSQSFHEANELMSRFETLHLNYVDLIDKADENDEALKSLQKEHIDFIQVI